MPLSSSKSSKKTNSKVQLVDIVETQASNSLKNKLNKRNIISNLFGRGKRKSNDSCVTEVQPPSLTCLFSNNNASDASSTNISSIKNEIASNIEHKCCGDKSEKDIKQKSRKENMFDKIRKSLTNQTENIHEFCQKSKENLINYEKCCGINECPSICLSQEIPLIMVLKEVLQFNNRLQESENRLIQIFGKYLKDNNLQKQLVDIVSNHARLQIQIERRNQALASMMWKQQSDLYKSQEKVLTENLKEMVWQNRKLQEENELLMRRMDFNRCDKNINPFENDQLHQTNERLRNKLSNVTEQLHELENNLLNERSRCGTLEEQFSVYFTELQTEKANIQAIKLDHQLEIANIKQELDSKDEIINDAIKFGDELLNDMEHIKQEIPSLKEFYVNSKHQKNPLLRIIATSKLCLENIFNKILQLQKELETISSERDYFKSESSKYQKTLEATSHEIVNLMKQTDLLNEAIHEKEKYLTKVNQLEKERMVLEGELNGKCLQLEEIKQEKIFMIEGMHQIKDLMSAKENELKIIKAENETLAFQNKSLSQILMQSGSGEVARELATSQEKIQVLQSHYCQVVSYKDQLEEKLKMYSNEIESLKTINSELTEKINTQAKSIEELNESKLKLNEEFLTQQATLTALQNDRRRHLAEKNFLRSIYDKIEQNASNTECLKGSLCEVTKEADRLAIIAEFNKQLGERYQTEIAEKDELISELKATIKRLNNFQEDNVKEKVALCEELTEMCSIKDNLANKLEMEVKKSFFITESAKENECSVNEELKVLKEMQKIERSAVKELLEDFNTLVTQRDCLLKFKMDAQNQLELLQQQVSDYQKEFDKKGKDLIEKEQAIIWLDTQLRSSDEKSKSLTNTVENTYKKQLCDMEQLVEENSKLLADINKYKSSIDYLKSNVHNLQTCLDNSRKHETEYKKLLEIESEKCKNLSEELKECTNKHLACTEELGTLRERLGQLQKDYNILYSNHEEIVREISDQPGLLEDYKSTKRLLQEYHDEIGCFKEKISSQITTIENLQKNNQKLEEIIEELTIQEKNVNKNLIEIISEKELLNNKLHISLNEFERLKNELADKLKLLEEKSKNEHHLENTLSDAQIHIKDLMNTLQLADENNIKLKSKLEITQSMYRTLEDTHRKLAEKLLKTVHGLMNEKMLRRTAETTCDQLNNTITKIEMEKNDLIQKTKSQNDTIKNQEKKCSDMEISKTELEEQLTESVTNYREILNRYDEVIRDFAATEIKCKDYELKLSNYLSTCSKCKSLEEKMYDLKSSLDSSHEDLATLQNTITTLKLTITSLEFQKSEHEIYTHDLEKRLNVERSLREETQESNSKIVTKMLQLQNESKISKSTCDILLSIVHSSS
nr:uncharacterized protein PFB0765w-like [Onthophagus taurus]